MTAPAKLPWNLMPGIPARDDPEVESLLAVFAALPRENLENVVRDLLRCAVGWKRTGSPDYLTCLAEDALVTIGLRRDHPEIDRALRDAPERPAGPSGSVDVEEMLRERGLSEDDDEDPLTEGIADCPRLQPGYTYPPEMGAPGE